MKHVFFTKPCEKEINNLTLMFFFSDGQGMINVRIRTLSPMGRGGSAGGSQPPTTCGLLPPVFLHSSSYSNQVWSINVTVWRKIVNVIVVPWRCAQHHSKTMHTFRHTNQICKILCEPWNHWPLTNYSNFLLLIEKPNQFLTVFQGIGN